MSLPISIIGGGLAGLALGNGLRLAGVDVRLVEAGHYPRHHVCGEFLTGLRLEGMNELGIRSCFEGSLSHSEVAWFRKDQLIRTYQLPTPALGISRFTLDHRLALLFRERGGCLLEGERQREVPAEGSVWATGRDPRKGGFTGLKAHWRGVELKSDLEVHLGRQAYVGLSRVEAGAVNVCGLFRRIATGSFPSFEERFYATLRNAGLPGLVNRLRKGSPDPESICSVSGLGYGSRRPETADRLELGDRHAMIPPFTGHGMTIALESAASVLPFLKEYADGGSDWQACVHAAHLAQCKQFSRRRRIATRLHPFLLHSPGQLLLACFARARVLPFGTVYGLTHI